MISDISENFNIDLDRVYACGMSNVGYMSYRLACDLSDKIAAFGSVTGNFMINDSVNDCQDQNRDIPIIHFHGTDDSIVNYYPPSFDGALTIEESIQFWSSYKFVQSVTPKNTKVFHSIAGYYYKIFDEHFDLIKKFVDLDNFFIPTDCYENDKGAIDGSHPSSVWHNKFSNQFYNFIEDSC